MTVLTFSQSVSAYLVANSSYCSRNFLSGLSTRAEKNGALWDAGAGIALGPVVAACCAIRGAWAGAGGCTGGWGCAGTRGWTGGGAGGWTAAAGGCKGGGAGG